MAFFNCAPAKKQTLLNADYQATFPSDARNYVEQSGDYKLQPGDVISIKVSSLTPEEFNFFSKETSVFEGNDPLLSGFLLDRDGNIVLPQIGSVLVKGLTIPEVQEQLKKILSDYLDSPSVYARLVSFHYTVLGEVTRQGRFSLLQDRINLLEALGTAGGLTEYADYEQVKILRSENGVSKVHHVNILAENLPSNPLYYLQPNDVVIVGQLKNKNFRRNSAGNIGLILSGIATAATVIIAFDRLN